MEVAIVSERAADPGSLIRTRIDAAYRLARAILLDDRDAEDAVQEAVLSAWRRQAAMRDPQRFEAWFDQSS